MHFSLYRAAFLALLNAGLSATQLVAYVPQFGKDLEIVSYLWMPLIIDIRVIGRAIENLGERGPRGGVAEMEGRGWWKRDGGARPGDDRKRRDARWPRGRRLTVALPLDVVGELDRPRSKIACPDQCKVPNSRLPDGLTRTGNPAASRWTIADPPGVKRTMQPGRSRDYGLCAAWAGRMSDDVDQHRPSSVRRLGPRTS